MRQRSLELPDRHPWYSFLGYTTPIWASNHFPYKYRSWNVSYAPAYRDKPATLKAEHFGTYPIAKTRCNDCDLQQVSSDFPWQDTLRLHPARYLDES
ncbi:hypothetical protein D3C72_1773630 [compost metagenome]